MAVEVGVRQLRAHLSHWLDRAAAGEEVIVTERGRPRVRLLGVDQTTTLEQLVADGVVAPPAKAKRGWAPRQVGSSSPVSPLVRDERAGGH